MDINSGGNQNAHLPITPIYPVIDVKRYIKATPQNNYRKHLIISDIYADLIRYYVVIIQNMHEMIDYFSIYIVYFLQKTLRTNEKNHRKFSI